jgi:hypothetical protein
MRLAKVILILKHSVKLRPNLLCGGMAARPSMACALCAVQSGTLVPLCTAEFNKISNVLRRNIVASSRNFAAMERN